VIGQTLRQQALHVKRFDKVYLLKRGCAPHIRRLPDAVCTTIVCLVCLLLDEYIVKRFSRATST
jgi:hypothetical protein